MKRIVAVLILASVFPFQALADDRTSYQQKRYPAGQQFKNQRTPPPTQDYRSYYGDAYENRAIGIKAGVRTAFRQDELQWNIAGDLDGTSPNILSELTWEKVGGAQVEPHISYTKPDGTLKGIHAQASVYRSKTFTGKNQDSDYLLDDRQAEFSRSNNDADDGHAQGLSVAVGYAFEFSGNRKKDLTRLLTLVGYSRHQQKYVMTNGNQTVSDFGWPTPLGPFDGLNSHYETDWSLPFIGATLQQYYNNHRFERSGKYYRGKYYADANWNLRSDFMHPKSFEHRADADGYSVGLEYGWMFYPNAELTLAAEWSNFYASDGIDTVFFADTTVVSTKLNEVNSMTYQYKVGLNYNF